MSTPVFTGSQSALQILAPIHGVAVADEPERGPRLRLALVQAGAVLLHHGRSFAPRSSRLLLLSLSAYSCRTVGFLRMI